jgi:hypothetical protein
MDDGTDEAHNFRKLIGRIMPHIDRKWLWELCDQFGVDKRGDPGQLIERFKDKFYPAPPRDVTQIMLPNVIQILENYQPLNFYRERDLEDDLMAELREHFGFENVHHQVKDMAGTVDIHIGPLYGPGAIGMEIKLPKNKSEIDRLKGQVWNYQQRYGQNVIIYFLSKDAILSQYIVQFGQFCHQYGIYVVRK